MALTLLSQAQVLDKYASMPKEHKEALVEVASNYLFDMAIGIKVPFNNIDKNDRLFKALDFLAQGWTIENAMSAQWRYLG
jgi:hypothetical protein